MFAVPAAAYAGGIPFFGPIIPQGANEAVCPASWGMLITVINNIISLLLTLAILFLMPIMIAYAGFLMVVNPTSIGDVGKARKIITNTVIGIVVALAAWLIVDAVMAVLYNPEAAGGTWYELVTGKSDDMCLSQAGSLPSDSLNQANLTEGLAVVKNSGTAGSAGNEQEVRQKFAMAGVTINHESCPSGSDGQGCTNVGGMLASTVNQVIAIKRACGNSCSVQVTGGTEPGHASGSFSHGTGYKVDLHPTDELDTFIESVMLRGGVRGGGEPGPIFLDSCKQNQYVRADDHWDITVYAYCAQL